MPIRLIEEEKAFSDREMLEMSTWLSALPASHIEAIETIERIAEGPRGETAGASSWGTGGDMYFTDRFFRLDEATRRCVFYHEVGHAYFDFKDEKEGHWSRARFGPYGRDDLSHLLRVQWMEIGKWDLDEAKLNRIREAMPDNDGTQNRYTYIVCWKNPTHNIGEWVCPERLKLKGNNRLLFRYDFPGYSPKEEQGDCYSMFARDKGLFLHECLEDRLKLPKYDFIQPHFEEQPIGQVEFVRS